jgi:hypothetical protein
MKKEEALNVIKQACSSVVANLDTHQQIQSAIRWIEEELTKVESKKK